jgi:uncharacterized protein with HEPN domain
MPARSVRIRLIDIREEIAGIRSLTKHATAQSFGADWVMKRAVQHALLIISEATRHIPDDLKNARPEVPWKDIHGLGNMLRHIAGSIPMCCGRLLERTWTISIGLPFRFGHLSRRRAKREQHLPKRKNHFDPVPIPEMISLPVNARGFEKLPGSLRRYRGNSDESIVKCPCR